MKSQQDPNLKEAPHTYRRTQEEEKHPLQYQNDSSAPLYSMIQQKKVQKAYYNTQKQQSRKNWMSQDDEFQDQQQLGTTQDHPQHYVPTEGSMDYQPLSTKHQSYFRMKDILQLQSLKEPNPQGTPPITVKQLQGKIQKAGSIEKSRQARAMAPSFGEYHPTQSSSFNQPRGSHNYLSSSLDPQHEGVFGKKNFNYSVQETQGNSGGKVQNLKLGNQGSTRNNTSANTLKQMTADQIQKNQLDFYPSSSPQGSGAKSLYSYQKEANSASPFSKLTPSNLNKFLPVSNWNSNPITKFTYNPNNQDDRGLKYDYGQPHVRQITDEMSMIPSAQVESEMTTPRQTSDMESIIGNMRSKMKNLESKYLDLANFYKKELVSQRQSEKSLQIGQPAQKQGQDLQSRVSSNMQVPTKAGTMAGSDIDVQMEKTIIGELIQEKTDLERELQVMLQMQNNLQEEEEKLHQRLDEIEKENDRLKQYPLELKREQIDRLKTELKVDLARFEQQLIHFINENYQTYTDDDIQEQFQRLNDQIPITIDRLVSLDMNFKEHQVDSEEVKAFKKALIEYDLSYQYTTQNQKRVLLDLQTKHDASHVSAKKIGQALMIINQATQDFNLSLANIKNQEAQFNLNFKSGNVVSPKVNALQITQNKLLFTLQSQTHVIDQGLSSLEGRLSGVDKDMRVLKSIEDERVCSLQILRQSIEQLEFRQENQSRRALQTMNKENRTPNEIKNLKHLEAQVKELQKINDMLQADLQSQSSKMEALLSDNTQLQSKLKNDSHSRQLFSPTWQSLAQISQENAPLHPAHNPIMMEKRAYMNRSAEREPKVHSIRSSANMANFGFSMEGMTQENERLAHKILGLNRSLEEKDQELERVRHELNHVATRQRQSVNPRSGEQTDSDLERNQIRDRLMDTEKKVRLLVKMIKKFLSLMNRLRQAVHRKEPSIQKEKNEFEQFRKQLEDVIARISNEYKDQRDTSPITVNLMRASINSKGLRASSLDERISNDDSPPIQAQIKKYQINSSRINYVAQPIPPSIQGNQRVLHSNHLLQSLAAKQSPYNTQSQSQTVVVMNSEDNQAVASFDEDSQKLRDLIEEKEEQIKDLKSQLDQMVINHAEQLKKLKQDYLFQDQSLQTEIRRLTGLQESLKKEHELQLVTLDKENEQKIVKLNEEFQEKLAAIENQKSADAQFDSIRELDTKIKEAEQRFKKDMEAKIKELKDKHKAEVESLNREWESRMDVEKELAISEYSASLKIQKDSEKITYEKEKQRLEQLIKDEREEFRRFKEENANEILGIQNEYDQQIEELTTKQLSREHELKESIQNKDKLLKQLKADQSKLMLEKEQTHRQKIDQLEEEYMLQIEKVKEELDEVKKHKDSMTIQQSKEISQIKLASINQQENLKKIIAQKEAQIRELSEQLNEQQTINSELQHGSQKSVNSQIEKLKSQQKKDEALLKHQEQEIESLKIEVQQVRDQVTESEYKVQEKENNVIILEDQLRQRDQEIKKLKKQIKSNESEINSLRTQEEQLNSDLKTLTQTNNELELQVESLSIQLNDAKTQAVQFTNIPEPQNMIDTLQGNFESEVQAFRQKEEEYKSQIQTLEQQQVIQRQKIDEQNQKQSQIQQQLKELTKINKDLTSANEQLTEDNQGLVEEIETLQEQNHQHQQTLEKNRSLIQMLKTELQKSIDKQKNQQSDTLSQQSDRDRQDRERDVQLEQLREQITKLKEESNIKIEQQQKVIMDFTQLMREKQELLEQAEQAIVEYNDERNLIGARIKYLSNMLTQQLEQFNNSGIQDNDQIEITQQLNLLEQKITGVVIANQTKIEQIQGEKEVLREEKNKCQQELNQLKENLVKIQREMKFIAAQQEDNDSNLRKQLDTAQRKLSNYKQKVTDKQREINQLKQERMEVEQSKNITQGLGTSRDNVELLQKLQRAENELQIYRLAQQKKSNSPDQSLDDQSMRVDLKRLNQIEESISGLRKQLFGAKDQVICTLSETFSKKVKELQNVYMKENILKAKLSEICKDKQVEQNLNNNVKLVKRVNMQGQKRVLIVQVISNGECYLLDESKICESALAYLKNYIPDPSSGKSECLIDQTSLFTMMEDKDKRVFEQLEEQIKEMREERQELQQEISIYKNKMMNEDGFEQLRDLRMEELEDDVGHLNAENQELRMKIKDLSIQNSMIRQRVIELNNIVLEISLQSMNKAEDQQLPRRLLSLVEEVEQIKIQLSRQLDSVQKRDLGKVGLNLMHHGSDEFDDGSFLQGIQVAGNRMSQHRDDGDDNNLFDQSSLYGVLQHIPERDTVETQNIQVLQKQLEESKAKVKSLEAQIQKQHEQSLNREDQKVLSHVKGTLTQFLKRCPVTDKDNEMLLEVVLQIMNYSRSEIADLNDQRKGRLPSSNRSGSVNVDTEEDAKGKVKKGIFGMFKKAEKDSSLSRRPISEQHQSPALTIKRHN